MNLHENTELFEELRTAASQPEERGGLGIRQAFLEKDYWVTLSQQMLAENRFAEQAVFKGVSYTVGGGVVCQSISI